MDQGLYRVVSLNDSEIRYVGIFENSEGVELIQNLNDFWNEFPFDRDNIEQLRVNSLFRVMRQSHGLVLFLE